MTGARSCFLTAFILLLIASISLIYFEYNNVRSSAAPSGRLDGSLDHDYHNEMTVVETVYRETDREAAEETLKETDRQRGKEKARETTREPYRETVGDTEKERTREKARVRNERLKNHLRDACKTLNISFNINNNMLKHMLIDQERKVMYCYVPKVACTSWKRIWMRMVGLVEQNTDIGTLHRNVVHKAQIPSLHGRTKEYITEVFQSYKKYMFVRHPFDRVLSAYKDKFESQEAKADYSFHRDIGVQIKTRNYPNYTGNGDGVTFAEFIEYISVEGGLTAGQRNEHWLSVHQLCNPCYVQYDFIGKYETLKEDADYVLDWIGVTDLPGGFPASDRSFHAKRYDPKYIEQLNHNHRMGFFKKYLTDFVALNYTFV